ncbi:MAG: CRISPR-associated helicase Cas3' [Christensenellaceae bacterium]
MGENMTAYAHTREDGSKQTLLDHLTQTAKLSAEFAGAYFAHSAYLAGLLHDLGKYQQAFQRRLEGSSVTVDHAIVGALAVAKYLPQYAILFQYVIAGHHTGLLDCGTRSDVTGPSLSGRLKEHRNDGFDDRGEILPLIDANAVAGELDRFFSGVTDREQLADAFSFAVRYLFSCLTDADSLDTEAFCTGFIRAHLQADWQDCARRVQERLDSFQAKTELQRARTRLQRQAMEHLTDASVHLLDMPTGSGKTLCSVALAMERLKRTGKKRIIYIIPYTSIIEQTAQVFEDLFPNTPILQHHSHFDFDEDVRKALYGEEPDESGNATSETLKRSAENWDAPIILTTNVQFFESIYGNRRSKLRKLHHMADSILVFDEMHTLPVDWFIPCMKAIFELTERYGSEAFFLTATMPDFATLAEQYVGRKVSMIDLVPDRADYALFDKCTYRYIGERDVLSELPSDKNCLIVVNTKQTAEKYYRAYAGEKYYLTTALTSCARSKRIGEIRARMESGEKGIAVFATSLIEAGVDLDFDLVYREIAGLDHILQTGGRCNREGKRKKEESVVTVFVSDQPARGELQFQAQIVKGLLEEYGVDSIASSECIRKYFDLLYRSHREDMKRIGLQSKPTSVAFAKIAKEFHLIDRTSVEVIVPCEEILSQIEALRRGESVNRRMLRRHAATVSVWQLKKLAECGAVCEVNGAFLLEAAAYYSDEVGIMVDPELDYII